MAEVIDKRPVSTDALQTLGSIIGEGEKRDAIHLAVEPAVAGEDLPRGTNVGRLKDGTFGAAYGGGIKPLGIVDPFLKHSVKKGERFWLIIYPRQITALHHVWEHPDFPSVADRVDKVVDRALGTAKSEEWIRNFAGQVERHDGIFLTYREVMEAAEEWIEKGELACMGEDLDYDFLEKNIPEFWLHYSRITRQEVPDDKMESFFRCAC